MTPPEQSADKLADRLAEVIQTLIEHDENFPCAGYSESEFLKLKNEWDSIIQNAIKALAAYRETIRSAPKEAITDTQRLDWLDSECFDLGTNGECVYVVSASDGENFYADSIREAVDDAILDAQSNDREERT